MGSPVLRRSPNGAGTVRRSDRTAGAKASFTDTESCARGPSAHWGSRLRESPPGGSPVTCRRRDDRTLPIHPDWRLQQVTRPTTNVAYYMAVGSRPADRRGRRLGARNRLKPPVQLFGGNSRAVYQGQVPDQSFLIIYFLALRAMRSGRGEGGPVSGRRGLLGSGADRSAGPGMTRYVKSLLTGPAQAL
jgi:hypothetical protein